MNFGDGVDRLINVLSNTPTWSLALLSIAFIVVCIGIFKAIK